MLALGEGLALGRIRQSPELLSLRTPIPLAIYSQLICGPALLQIGLILLTVYRAYECLGLYLACCLGFEGACYSKISRRAVLIVGGKDPLSLESQAQT